MFAFVDAEAPKPSLRYHPAQRSYLPHPTYLRHSSTIFITPRRSAADAQQLSNNIILIETWQEMSVGADRRLDVLAGSTVSDAAGTLATLPSPASTTFDQTLPLWRKPALASYNGDPPSIIININDGGSTGRGILIGILSAFGSAGVAVLVLAIFFFFRYTNRGRILLDRIGRPGEYDDEQAFAREETEALESMDDLQKTEYMRAKGEEAFCLTH